MALHFPSRTTCRFDTAGERRLAERLEKKLSDNWLCWFNVPVGPKGLRPDFVVMHPQRGILVLEVKDWKVETIASMTAEHARIHAEGQLKTVANPLEQARINTMAAVNLLQRDPALKQPAGANREGNLLMPYSWGVVLTEITRKQFESAGLADVLAPQRVICRDEMTETVESEDFEARLVRMFVQMFSCRLTEEQIDRVRYHLFPEVRVNVSPGQFGLFSEHDAPVPSFIKVMDLQQEQLARSMGEGHRVIHGVAGSGKTMILGYRCVYLAQTSSKPILVLCYNKSLAGRLKQVLAARGLSDKVSVRNFHGWCWDLLKASGGELPDNKMSPGDAKALLERNVLLGVANGQIAKDQYAGILIDEGHDFQPEWFKLAVDLLDPASNSLLVLYDDAQSIYRGRAGKGGMEFSFASVGIQASGRTTILRLNYRNTLEVLSVARAFSLELLNAREAQEDNVPIVAPQSAGRRGRLPELLHCATPWLERDCIVERLRDEQRRGRALEDMAVIYRHSTQAVRIEKILADAGIPFVSGRSSKDRSKLYDGADAVKIVSMHSSKGLEFGLVIIPALHDMPIKGEDEADEARLLYVAMTRTIDRLVMMYRDHSSFTRRVHEAISAVREHLAQVDTVASVG
ncbi:NERD domain-containing protein/DEAD/DEAH box helicase [Pseudomonas sp. N3-W]|uniref:DEAD/DEAH box helicase n=1 Tax=Pseudomonas sp. N3-W TaxID=2975049 RepID=UPI00217F08F0|nr:NERD domain-containing protein/DEAD/DEAH box helicase [Pseudomonas sp. N3-W]UWF50122.1 NERD domain-containing protein/DEAD/DEAH box helicase [Pseudomonas sp. N3-W]